VRYPGGREAHPVPPARTEAEGDLSKNLLPPPEPGGHFTILDTSGRYSFTIHLEASRRGNDRDGWQYTITVSAHDYAGNTGSAATMVIVPQNQGQGQSVAASQRHRAQRQGQRGLDHLRRFTVAGRYYSATAIRGQRARDRLQDCVEHLEGERLTMS
jgi:hypothetical protein